MSRDCTKVRKFQIFNLAPFLQRTIGEHCTQNQWLSLQVSATKASIVAYESSIDGENQDETYDCLLTLVRLVFCEILSIEESFGLLASVLVQVCVSLHNVDTQR